MKRTKQFIIFTGTSLAGMYVSHYIPDDYFYYWVVASLMIGHLINIKTYK